MGSGSRPVARCVARAKTRRCCVAAIRLIVGLDRLARWTAIDLQGLSLTDVPRGQRRGIPSWRDGTGNVDLRRPISRTVYIPRPARELRRCFPQISSDPDVTREFRLLRVAKVCPNSEETGWGDASARGGANLRLCFAARRASSAAPACALLRLHRGAALASCAARFSRFQVVSRPLLRWTSWRR